jgi:hypothetical protein
VSATVSSPSPELTPSLVVTPPTRAPVYLAGHTVRLMTRHIQRRGLIINIYIYISVCRHTSVSRERREKGEKGKKNAWVGIV